MFFGVMGRIFTHMLVRVLSDSHTAGAGSIENFGQNKTNGSDVLISIDIDRMGRLNVQHP
jgi:hypothetical protein